MSSTIHSVRMRPQHRTIHQGRAAAAQSPEAA